MSCILSWAVKKKALTKDLAGAIFEAVDLAGGFDNRVYELLTAAYEICPRQSMLASYAAT